LTCKSKNSDLKIKTPKNLTFQVFKKKLKNLGFFKKGLDSPDDRQQFNITEN